MNWIKEHEIDTWLFRGARMLQPLYGCVSERLLWRIFLGVFFDCTVYGCKIMGK